MRFMRIFLAALAACGSTVSAIDVGETAPQFSLSTYDGGTFSLAQQKGKVTVLFFLGCT